MNKEITIIDLLNKIANNEVDIKKIKYDNQIFEYREDMLDYYCYDYDLNLMGYQKCLNDKVEIIEEDNKIKKIQTIGSKWYSEYVESYFDGEEEYSAYDEYLMNKINELIDEVNQLKENNK